MNSPTEMESLKAELQHNYKLMHVLGHGSFGIVIKGLKKGSSEMVALKILNRSVTKKSKKIENIKEVRILETLRSLDADKSNIVKFYECFSMFDRVFMVFEILDISLFQFMHRRHWLPLPLEGIRIIMADIATALVALTSVGVIHTDLKLDNVMLVDQRRTPYRVKIIDFGISLLKYEVSPGLIVQPPGLRSPEVILGLPFSEAIDIWSAGMILGHMLSGYSLCPVKHEYESLLYIIELLGEPPKEMLDKGIYTQLFFNKKRTFPFLKIIWTFKHPSEMLAKLGEVNAHKFTSMDDILTFRMQHEINPAGVKCCMDLLREMLQINPKRRISASEVLHHPFITQPNLSKTPSSIPPVQDASSYNQSGKSKRLSESSSKVTSGRFTCALMESAPEDEAAGLLKKNLRKRRRLRSFTQPSLLRSEAEDAGVPALQSKKRQYKWWNRCLKNSQAPLRQSTISTRSQDTTDSTLNTDASSYEFTFTSLSGAPSAPDPNTGSSKARFHEFKRHKKKTWMSRRCLYIRLKSWCSGCIPECQRVE
ncbi:homeodomain-interacting protein kinase 2-like isoform X1 [Synchiropus splendidus]|uniref:homeodomain-interacting protein kinase 2-like isoform X1 n=1 Tax=Synchiropus splendidus TaxID=270530 RepID=UPI00237ECAB4|nr:homeodomain-interacting protein kinase 2-like isoform X1 [Synchiropus splendidus]XP_053711656.1 homeodomain-interacting protein kinase 2-like isoform X1 [Synchiropus splendidus]